MSKDSFNMMLIRENNYGEGLVLEDWSLLFNKILQCFSDMIPINPLKKMFLTPPVSDSSFSAPQNSDITNISVLWFSDLK